MVPSPKDSDLKALAEAAKKHGSSPAPADRVDVYVVLRVHGEFLVTSFWSAVEPSAEQFWESILEYVTVEVQWWCDDRKKPVDTAAFARTPLYQMHTERQFLERVLERSQMQAYCDDVNARRVPLAVFSGVPDEEMLEQLKIRYEQVSGTSIPWRLT